MRKPGTKAPSFRLREVGHAARMVTCPCDPKKVFPRQPLRSFARILIAGFACFYLSGAHLALLQLVAWGGMVVAYSAESGLKKGLSEVASGEKPCCMCKALQKARQAESRQGGSPDKALPPGLEKLTKEMTPQNRPRLVDCPCTDTRLDRPDSHFDPNEPLPNDPPVPPPRLSC